MIYCTTWGTQNIIQKKFSSGSKAFLQNTHNEALSSALQADPWLDGECPGMGILSPSHPSHPQFPQPPQSH